jgi:hypothetical protein
MRRIGSVIVVTGALVAHACGSSSNTKKDGAVDTHVGDAPRDAAVDARPDAPLDGPPNTVQLTVKNYLSWCVVEVGSGSFSPAGIQMMFVGSGVTSVTAKANGSGFQLGSGMWHHTDGDAGSGDDGTQTGTGSAATSLAHVTMTLGTPKCVWVCCPFAGGSGCGAVPEQCQ